MEAFQGHGACARYAEIADEEKNVLLSKRRERGSIEFQCRVTVHVPVRATARYGP